MTVGVSVYYLVIQTPQGRWQRIDAVQYATLLEADQAAQRAKVRRPDDDVRIMSEVVTPTLAEAGEDEA